MHYRGDFSVDFPEPLDEITFVIPTAGKIIFNHATESVGFGQIGLAIGDLSRRFVFCLVSCFLGCPKNKTGPQGARWCAAMKPSSISTGRVRSG
ncbi:hypothetical protein D3C85_1759210 [compost metagenome]